jgi:hypothetical protein
MRTAPNRAGTKHANAKKTHQNGGHARSGQDGVMLVIVVDDKKPDHQ